MGRKRGLAGRRRSGALPGLHRLEKRRGDRLELGRGSKSSDRTATLADSKTGRSVRPLSAAACRILSALPRSGDLVFKAGRGTGRMTGFPIVFSRIRERAGLPDDITPHVLRHSFASVAGDLGYGESTIGALIGHKGASITSRYMHSADAVLLAAADTVAGRIDLSMGGCKMKRVAAVKPRSRPCDEEPDPQPKSTEEWSKIIAGIIASNPTIVENFKAG